MYMIKALKTFYVPNIMNLRVRTDPSTVGDISSQFRTIALGSYRQPSMIAYHDHGKLNREKIISPYLCLRVSRVRFSRRVPLQSAHFPYPVCISDYLSDFTHPSYFPLRVTLEPCATGLVSSFIRSRIYVSMVFIAEKPPVHAR